MTTRLQKQILDALDEGGHMTFAGLEGACKIAPNRRGGFRSTVSALFSRGLINGDEFWIWITPNGVHEVEAIGIAADRSELETGK